MMIDLVHGDDVLGEDSVDVEEVEDEVVVDDDAAILPHRLKRLDHLRRPLDRVHRLDDHPHPLPGDVFGGEPARSSDGPDFLRYVHGGHF